MRKMRAMFGKQLSLKQKIQVLVGVPISLILVFTLFFIAQQFQQWQKAQEAKKEFVILEQYLSLTSELAKERGLFIGAVTGTQNTQAVLQRLQKQQQRVDKKLSQLPILPDGDHLAKDMAKILQAIPSVRHRIASLKGTTNADVLSERIFREYSALIEQLHMLIKEYGYEHNGLGVLKKLQALYDLYELKEAAGQERGVTYGVLEAKRLMVDDLRPITVAIAKQNRLQKLYPLDKQDAQIKELMPAIQQVRHGLLEKALRDEYLNSTLNLIGYGGLIHQFKNYLIRKDPKYYQAFVEKYQQLSHLYQKIQTDYRLTPETQRAFKTIYGTMTKYRSMLDIIQKAYSSKIDVQKIDHQVKVFDGAALEAIASLENQMPKISSARWWQLTSQRIEQFGFYIQHKQQRISNRLHQRVSDAYTNVLVAIGVIGLLLGLLIILGNALLRSITVGFEALHKNLAVLKSNQDGEAVQTVKGDDELSQIVNTFARLIRENKNYLTRMKLFYEAVKNIDQAVMMTDQHNQLTFVNKAFEKMTGYQREEVIGKNPKILSSHKQSESFYQQMWQALEETGHFTGTFVNRRKDGREYPVETSISKVIEEMSQQVYYVGIQKDISERLHNEAEIWQKANVDQLTGLYNRNYLMARLHQDIEAAERKPQKFALMFLDLDGFKYVNDTLGHAVGDALLCEVARCLRSQVRASDVLARLGGDEFVVIIREIDEVSAVETRAEEIRNVIQKITAVQGYLVEISCSIGISLFPDDAKDVETLLKYADTAMYESKAAGKNMIQFYQPQMQQAISDMVEIHNELKLAIQQNQLELYYQPVIELATGKLVGAESLVRWQHPEKGLIFPDQFIPVAEKMGTISKLGEWVLQQSFHQGIEWYQQGLIGEDFYLSVNVAAQQFLKDYELLWDQLKRKQSLLQTQSVPNLIQLEITEGVLINDEPELIERMNAIKGLGYSLLLDDFGTGYSSLSYLKRFPIDKLKVDKSFVMDMLEDEEDYALVQAVISMANALGLIVVSEGVESEEHVVALQQLGCEYAQGYFYAKPLPAEAFAEFVKSHQA